MIKLLYILKSWLKLISIIIKKLLTEVKKNNITNEFRRQIVNLYFFSKLRKKKNKKINVNDHPDNTLFFNWIDVKIYCTCIRLKWVETHSANLPKEGMCYFFSRYDFKYHITTSKRMLILWIQIILILPNHLYSEVKKFCSHYTI